MNIHEHQAKALLAAYGIEVPRGLVASSGEEARQAAVKLGGRVVVKAQVHAGGRGKGGGVRVVEDSASAASAATDILGRNLVTPQTDKNGVPVAQVLVEEALSIVNEFYLAVVVDTSTGAGAVIASREGGMEIEQVAATSPSLILRASGDSHVGLLPYKARDIANALIVDPQARRKIQATILAATNMFKDKDCSLIEINPLVVTTDGNVLAADAKVTLEDDALFRHPELANLRDPSQINQLELRAQNAGISYVKLEAGSVGCMVNGAGLAMATMDMARASGYAPANFLDIGGSTSMTKIEQAYNIIASDADVQVILINLFAGIARADMVAEGVVTAAKSFGRSIPMVVAMRGTNSEEGRRILERSGLPIHATRDLAQAADKLKVLLTAAGRRGGSAVAADD